MLAWVIVLSAATRAYGQAISLTAFTQLQGLGSLEDNCLLQDRPRLRLHLHGKRPVPF